MNKEKRISDAFDQLITILTTPIQDVPGSGEVVTLCEPGPYLDLMKFQLEGARTAAIRSAEST